MEGEETSFPLFPANYVTLQQLKERRMKEKQQREEEEEREKLREREEEEMRLRKEKEDEEARERLKKEEEKVKKKMKEPIKSDEVGNDGSRRKNHGGRRIGARWENKELETEVRKDDENVDKEQVGEHNKPRRKRYNRNNRRKTAEDEGAAGFPSPTLTDGSIQSPIHFSDWSGAAESKLQRDRTSNVASPAAASSSCAKSEARIRRERGIARKLRDLKIINNETGENNGIVSEAESSTAVVSECGISPEAGTTRNIVNAEVDGAKTAAVAGQKGFKSRSVDRKRGGSGERYPAQGSLKDRSRRHGKSRIWIRKEDLSGESGGDHG